MAKAKRFKEKARRAKKTEMPKKLLLVPVTLAVVGTSIVGMKTSVNRDTTNMMNSEIKTYNVSVSVEDTFTESNTKYLPIIYKDAYDTITKEDVLNAFRMKNIEVVEIPDTIVNGSQVKTTNATYTVLIYGDVDGNGKVNVRDVQAIIRHLLYGNGSELTGISKVAANVYEENIDRISVRDAQKIIKFILGKEGIIGSTPTSDLVADKEVPVITLNPDANGNTDITINVTDKAEVYKDPLGATVTDNLDPYVKVNVDTSVVKTNVPGDYQIIYTAEDASGNKAQTVVRTVHVVDYVKDIAIEKLPNRTEYIVGQDISLDGMVAYEVKAYAGKQKDPIDLSKIEFTPIKATMDMVDKDTKVTFKYAGVEKNFTIKVKKQQPMINLNDKDVKVNDKGVVVVKVFETYNLDDVVSVTDESGNKLDFEVSKTYKKVENGKETDVSAIDTNVPGKYKIYYKTTKPNSAGVYGETTREVEIVNYIASASDVTFEGLDNLEGKTFVDEDKISASGIKVMAKYAYGDAPVEVNATLKFTPETAKYEKPDSTGKVTNKVKVSCTIKDEYEGKDVEYSSTEVSVNVIKKFQTIETVGNIASSAEVYRKTKIATIKAGDNEDKIDISKLNIEITPNDTDNHGNGTESCKPEVETKSLDNGYVEVYFKGVNTTPYRITITPPSGSPVTVDLTMTILDAVTGVSVEYKTLDGKLIKIGDKDGVRFKAGDTIAAELTFYHKYDSEPELVIPNISAARVQDIKVFRTGTAGEEIDGITVTPAQNVNGKVRIIITSTEDQGIKAGENNTPISLSFKVDNQSANYAEGEETIPDVMSTDSTVKMYSVDMYETSKYDVKLRGTDNNELRGIKLTVKDASLADAKELTFDNTKAVGIGNGSSKKYYTIAKISLEDQYVLEDGIRDVLPSEINSKIEFRATKSGRDVSSDINVIGVVYDENTKSYREASGAEEKIEYIGIRIVDDKEKELENANLEVVFKGDKAGDPERTKNIGTITIDRRDIAHIVYVDSYTATGKCYEDTNIMKFTSGDKENEFTEKELKDIKFELTKSGSTTNLFENSSTEYTNETETSVTERYRNRTDGKIWGGATKTLSVNSTTGKTEVDISIWLKDSGNYSIKPYIVVNGNTVRGTAKTVTVEEELSIDKVSFNDKLTDEEIDSIPTSGVEDNVDFGTVRLGESVIKTIHYYHSYNSDRALLANGNKPDVREVQQVASGMIKVTEKTDSKFTSVNKMSGTIVINKDDDSTKDALINRLRIIVPDTETSGDIENFAIGIDNNGDGTADYTASVKVTFGNKLDPDYLKVGKNLGATGTENLNIYVTSAGLTNTDGFEVKPIDGEYYTLIPVYYMSTEGTRIYSGEIKGNMISESKSNKGIADKIVVLDNTEDKDTVTYGNKIKVKGLDENYVDQTGKDVVISYIAVAVNTQYQLLLNTSNPAGSGMSDEQYEELRLKTIKVYFTGSEVNKDTEKTFTIVKPDYTEQ